MTLTTRDLTMQRGCYEALSLEKPIITSDWEILRESFGEAAVYVNNSPEAISGGINKLLLHHEKYSAAVVRQRKKRRNYFYKTKDEILKRLAMV